MASTPGPWTVQQIGERTSLVWLSNGMDIGTGDETAACAIPDADAHLIAAAPELLAALKAIYAYTLPASHFFEGTPEFASARAAIAKAEGR